VFAVVAIEDGVLEVRRGAAQRDVKTILRIAVERIDIGGDERVEIGGLGEGAPQVEQVGPRGGFVERDADGPAVDRAQVQPAAWSASVWAPEVTVSVSKKLSLTSSKPSLRRPPARIAVIRATRCAMPRRPAGP
jgi:hypothetical protein